MVGSWSFRFVFFDKFYWPKNVVTLFGETLLPTYFLGNNFGNLLFINKKKTNVVHNVYNTYTLNRYINKIPDF